MESSEDAVRLLRQRKSHQKGQKQVNQKAQQTVPKKLTQDVNQKTQAKVQKKMNQKVLKKEQLQVQQKIEPKIKDKTNQKPLRNQKQAKSRKLDVKEEEMNIIKKPSGVQFVRGAKKEVHDGKRGKLGLKSSSNQLHLPNINEFEDSENNSDEDEEEEDDDEKEGEEEEEEGQDDEEDDDEEMGRNKEDGEIEQTDGEIEQSDGEIEQADGVAPARRKSVKRQAQSSEIDPYDVTTMYSNSNRESRKTFRRLLQRRTCGRINFDFKSIDALLESDNIETKTSAMIIKGLMIMKMEEKEHSINEVPAETELDLKTTVDPKRFRCTLQQDHELVNISHFEKYNGFIDVNEFFANNLVSGSSGTLRSVTQKAANVWLETIMPENMFGKYSTSSSPNYPQITIPIDCLNGPICVLQRSLLIENVGDVEKVNKAIAATFTRHLNTRFTHARKGAQPRPKRQRTRQNVPKVIIYNMMTVESAEQGATDDGQDKNKAVV